MVHCLVHCLCDVTNARVDNTVPELGVSIWIIHDLRLVLTVQENFIDIHLDSVSFDKPLKCLLYASGAKTADQIVSTTVRDE